MERRLLLLLNPCSGQKKANRLLPDIIRYYNGCGFEVVTYVTACNGDATEYMKRKGSEFDHIVCVGGDGTLNETIAGLIEGGVKCSVGYIPAGTTNDYANSLGLSSNILQAARDAVNGEPCSFDLGSFNGRHFIYTASCGAFARTSYTTSQTAKNLLGHLAYVLEGVKDLPTLRPMHMRIECEDRVLEGDYIFCAVTNSLSVGGILKLDPDMVRLNDGMFEVMLVKNPILPIHWTKILMALRNCDLPSEMIEFFMADRLKITTETEVEWTLDGEQGERGCNFEILNLSNRIELMLPAAAAENLPLEEEPDDAEDQLPD